MIQLQDLQSTFNLDVKPLKAAAGIAVAGVSAIAAGVGVAMKATMDWATEVDGLGDIMGGTNEEMAALAFAARKSGVGVDKLNKGVVILNKGLVKADGSLDTVGQDLKAFGIDVLDVNGKVRNQSDLMRDITNKYNSFGTQQEKVNFLTKTFGRSGADLIDFFDTLAADGGIDAVTKKVQALGLAIDPGRYEQFNRNLEELKLIGLGLAVQFTEKVMPAVEGFLDLIMNPDLTTGQKLDKLDNVVAGWINGLITSIDKWVSSGGPKKISDKIIGWVKDLGKDDQFKSDALIAAGNLVSALAEAIGDVKWVEIGDAIDQRIADAINGEDWFASGVALKDVIKGLFGGGGGSSGESITIGDTPTGSAIKAAFSAFLAGLYSDVEKAGQRFAVWLADMDRKLAGWVTTTLHRFYGWVDRVVDTLNTFEVKATNAIRDTLNGLETSITEKLRQIAKEFFTRAAGWANQMKLGFESGKAALIKVLEGLVGTINSILSGIITSFVIKIKLPFGLSIGGGSGGSTGGTTGGDNRPPRSGRAVGGPVVAGRSYNVAEFNRPEVFTPNQSGRIDPVRNQPLYARLTDDDLSRLSRTLATEMVKAMNNA